MIFVTDHAIDRFREWVAPVSPEEAEQSIRSHEKAIEAAAKFNCELVKCGNGSRLVVDGHVVRTVYGRGMLPRQCRRGGL